MNAAMEAHKSLIFVYGTLKTNHPNHFLMEDLITRNDAVFVGHRATRSPHPLVVGLHGIPYMINLPGSGHRVRGELYAVSKRGLARLDELEGIEVGHYERLPIEVAAATVTEEEGSDGIVAAEAYFAHRRFGERLWEKKGRCGMIEYGQNDGVRYVRPRDRPRSGSVLDEIEGFVSSRSD
ncbi:PREDICTED: putative gamma-glutamylcyclotransferase At3g02910 [Tarenaya hassleriana]|uniref:putative gamma-glutamylcyclotransferase At3g02910 n=1 Tax=Tarenaya hassleriana TaxID=28532 RepID=UPI00053C50DF|nr:PREDICTED: putative gamma-glutamylcyclotransferase At3g02910 [Tarenaya hassleriana]